MSNQEVLEHDSPIDIPIDKKEIEVTLTIFPFELTSQDIQKTIVQKLINTYEKKSHENMFIEEIIKIFPLENGKVGSQGEVNYNVKFEASVLMPNINDTMIGHIQKIIGSGIFVQKGPLRCFVKKQCFEPKDWLNLKLNQEIQVTLHSFRFQNFNSTINCVGEI